MATINFDASTVKPDEGRADPIPAGWYNVAMEKSEHKPTAGGTGSLLECIFGVLDGKYQGRKLYGRFNLQNNNQQTVEIAYRQLSAVMHAVGHLRCADSSELHGRPLKVKVKIRPAEGVYEAANDITAYKNINEVVDQPAATAAAIAPPAFPPPAAPAQWAPAVPAAAPAQPWAAQPPAAPAQPPAAPPMAPPPAAGAAPSWAPPAGAAPAQPWAAAAPVAPAPAAAAPVVPAPGPAQWAPPAAPAVAGGQPPWMTQPPTA